jgi:hypothetical protein
MSNKKYEAAKGVEKATTQGGAGVIIGAFASVMAAWLMANVAGLPKESGPALTAGIAGILFTGWEFLRNYLKQKNEQRNGNKQNNNGGWVSRTALFAVGVFIATYVLVTLTSCITENGRTRPDWEGINQAMERYGPQVKEGLSWVGRYQQAMERRDEEEAQAENETRWRRIAFAGASIALLRTYQAETQDGTETGAALVSALTAANQVLAALGVEGTYLELAQSWNEEDELPNDVDLALDLIQEYLAETP